MNFKTVLIVPFQVMLFVFSASAQDKIPATLDDQKSSLSILSPSIQYELKLQETVTWTIVGGFNFASDYSESIGWQSTLNPFTISMVRNYYKRKRVKKELLNNSGNYIALMAGYQFDKIADTSPTPKDAFFFGGCIGNPKKL